MRYFAEIGPGNIVLRVIVADDLAWCVETLGGWWVETSQIVPGENYASIGDLYDPTDPQKFIRQG